MRRRREGRSPAIIGALVLAVIVVLTVLGFRKDIPFVNEPYTVKAAFADSHGIKKNSPVRVAGVEVGRVRSVEGAGPRTRAAIVTMSIKDGSRPIHTDARARIRPRIFLEGNFYVQLQPGTPGTPEMGEDDVIPAERTTSAVQFDEVLKALRSDVRRDLRGIFAELFRTEAAGGAKVFNRSLRDQAAAYKYTAIVNEALLGRRPGDLARFLRSQGIVSEALDRDPEALKDLITNFNRTVAALADREADLRSAVDQLPETLEATRPAFAALNGAFPDVRRFAVEARPGIIASGPAARESTPFVAQLRGLVGRNELRGLSRDLRTAAPALASLANETLPLLEENRLLGSCVSNVITPWANDSVPDPNFKPTGPVHQEFAKGLVGLAGESRSFDANGQWFKVLGTGGVETFELRPGLFGAASSEILGVNPPADFTRPPLRPDVPCETQQPPDMRTNVGPAPRKRNIDMKDPAVAARTAKAQDVAVDLMRKKLKAQGSDIEVSDTPVTREQIVELAKSLGLDGQLQTLTQKVRAGG